MALAPTSLLPNKTHLGQTNHSVSHAVKQRHVSTGKNLNLLNVSCDFV